MGADQVLVQGAADAYKNRDAAGMKTAAEGLDKITKEVDSFRENWREKKIKENEDNKRLQEQAQSEMTKICTEMAPHHKALGKDAYEVFKTDVSGLREEMKMAVGPPRDEDAIMDINTRLAEMKSGAMADKDGYEAIVEGYESNAFDVKAMDPEHVAIHKEFLSNPTKKFVRTEDGKSAYTWEIPNPDYLDDIATPNVPQTIQREPITLDELNDMTIMPETKNGMTYMDHITEKTQLFNETQGKIKVEDLRRDVSKMIPKDPKALKAWAKSNPTENSELDVYQYLIDHPLINEASYAELGVQDTNDDGVINNDDLVSDEDKDLLIQKIMNAENPDVTHEVLTDIYTSIGYNTIHGKENKDYTPKDKLLMGDQVNPEAEAASIQQNKLNELKKDGGGRLAGESDTAYQTRLELTDDEMKNGVYDPDTKQKITPAISTRDAANSDNPDKELKR